ncbi:Uma2 family endonuclease [Streptomyces sp. NPDC093984]|uniref:Uma2 family endonuclease n=1 Tax=Streptomyces sp. NPDC093984 TaxID=3366052 RepID=UPI0038095B06
MTAVDDRPMTTDVVEFFENLEVPEGYKAELLRGEIVMMAAPDLVHIDIVEAVLDQFPRRNWRRLQTVAVAILQETSEPLPDLVLVERGVGPRAGQLMPSKLISMVVEVVSKTSVERDYDVKRSIYAAGGVPIYLIIDPIVGHCVLLTEPTGTGEEADYQLQRVTKFGAPVPLKPLGIELDTTEFGTYKGIKPHNRP